MTIWSASERPKFNINIGQFTGKRSNGLIGDIRQATKIGYYITPWGWMNVIRLSRESNGRWIILLAYDLTQRVGWESGMLLVQRPTKQLTNIHAQPSTLTAEVMWLGSGANRIKWVPSKRGFK